MKVLRWCAVLSLFLISHAYCEAAGEPSFSVRVVDFSTWGMKLCLSDPFEPGLNVVLVSDSGTCKARIAGKCTYRTRSNARLTGSRLMVDKACGRRGFTVGVVGVDHRSVRLVQPHVDKHRLPSEIEAKARRKLQEQVDMACRAGSLDESAPKLFDSPSRVWSFGNVKLLTFAHSHTHPDLVPFHYRVLITEKDVIPLAEMSGLFFFTVKRRLYLACQVSGVILALPSQYWHIYDLSHGSFKLVYDEAEHLGRRWGRQTR